MTRRVLGRKEIFWREDVPELNGMCPWGRWEEAVPDVPAGGEGMRWEEDGRFKPRNSNRGGKVRSDGICSFGGGPPGPMGECGSWSGCQPVGADKPCWRSTKITRETESFTVTRTENLQRRQEIRERDQLYKLSKTLLALLYVSSSNRVTENITLTTWIVYYL